MFTAYWLQLQLIHLRSNLKSWLASFLSDFDGRVGGFYFNFSNFLNFFYLCKIKGRGWVS